MDFRAFKKFCMIMRKKPRTVFLLGTLTALSLLSAESFHSQIEDDVDIVISMRSLAESRRQWKGHPFAQVVEDPQVQDFFAPLIDAQNESDEEGFTEVMENEFGLTWDELFELFPGELAIALHNLPELVMGDAERPELVIMADYTGSPERLSELMQIQFERNAESQKEFNPLVEHSLIEESFMGETLYLDETYDGEQTYIEDGYALVDGIFVLASPETRLRLAVEAIKAKPDRAMARNESYLRSRERGGRGDLQVYVNLEAILPPLNDALLKKSMESGAAMFGLSAKSLNAALSLESLLALFLDVDLMESGLRSHSGVIYREKAGLMRLMTYTGGPLPEARYVPGGVFSTSTTTFDFGAMLAQLEVLLGGASPTLPPLIDMQLQNVRTHTGVDVRSAILENFAGGLVSLSILPEGGQATVPMAQPEQVIVIGLHDAEALSSALEALKDLAPGMRELIETQEFAGQTIHTVKATPMAGAPESSANDVSYVITRTHFILNIGGVGLLQEVLSNLESGEEGFWQRAESELLFEQIAEPGAVSRSYVDLEKLVLPIFESIAQTSQLGGDSTALDSARIPKNLPVPFHLISEVNEEEDGIFGRSMILQREAAE